MKQSQKRGNQQGFTLVELLIATLVFSVVLMLCTFGVLQVTRTYYKGVNSAKTQQAARTIIDRISQGIQLSGGSVTTTPSTAPTAGTSAYFCVSNQRFNYMLGKKLVDGTNHVLVLDSTCTSPALNLNTASLNGEELMAPNMRLAKLTVTSAGNNLYNVTVRVVYGDDDLLCSPSLNDCSNTGTNTYSSVIPADLTCKDIRSGTQFCAFSELSTVVQKRLK